MKRVKTFLGGLTCLALSMSACQKNNDHGGLTSELEKIETIWDGVSEKNEHDVNAGLNPYALESRSCKGSPINFSPLVVLILQKFRQRFYLVMMEWSISFSFLLCFLCGRI